METHNSNISEMTPGIRPGETPPFYKIGEYVFQDLCCDLLLKDSAISTCDIYGKRRQVQFGIDLLASYADGSGIEVGQCKAYQKFTHTDIDKASKEFFKCWSHWEDKKVKKFILFVGCDLNDVKCQNEILNQKKNFAKYDIIYEAWSAIKIRDKLSPFRDLVARYCKPESHWLQEICGPFQFSPLLNSPKSDQITVQVQESLLLQIDQLKSHLSNEYEAKLENMRTAWREGHQKESLKRINEIKKDSHIWNSISSNVQAKLLRFEAALELDTNHNIEKAKELADKAHELAPSDNETKIRALIAYSESGIENALELFDGKKEIDDLNLKAALLLNEGRIVDCRQVLDSLDMSSVCNAETYRIKALLLLLEKNLEEAYSEISKAHQLAPNWKNIQFSLACIKYYYSVSPAAIPKYISDAPDPVPYSLIKHDKEKCILLRQAEREFSSLAEKEESLERAKIVQAWRLACLANDVERQEEAVSYCRSLLKEDPSHPYVIPWVIVRNFKIDLSLSQQALERVVEQKQETIPHVLALASCYFVIQEFEKVIALLDYTKSLFQSQHADGLWKFWKIPALVRADKLDKAENELGNPANNAEFIYLKNMILHQKCKVSGQWDIFIEHLENSYVTIGSAMFLLELCQVLAQLEKWPQLADRANELYDKIGTIEALTLASRSYYETQRYSECLEILENKSGINKQFLTRGLKQLSVLCRKELGLFPEAVAEAELLVKEDPSPNNLIQLAALYAQKGDLKALAILGRKVVDGADFSPQQLLAFSSSILIEDTQLAVLLWQKCFRMGVPDELITEALSLGYQLGLDNQIGPLIVRMQELGAKGFPRIQLISGLEEIKKRFRAQQETAERMWLAYRSGSLPIHAITKIVNQPLIYFYHTLLSNNEGITNQLQKPSLFIRHGGRAISKDFSQEFPIWNLHLDITAILLAAHLEILPLIEEVFKALFIPKDLITSIIAMQSQSAHPQPLQLTAAKKVIQFVQNGSIKTLSKTELDSECVLDFSAAIENKSSQFTNVVSKTEIPSINCRNLIETLYSDGPLSEYNYKQALEKLGSEGSNQILGPNLFLGTKLFCNGGLLKLLANSELLDAVCNSYDVSMEQQEYERLNDEIKKYEESIMLSNWTADLIGRINRGIDSGIYQIISVSTDDEDFDTIDMQCLKDLIRFKAKPNDVIWIEDRKVNSYVHKDGAVIIGISEVLKVLVTSKKINLDQYYEVIIKLRTQNTKFIAVQADEILYHLNQASVKEEEIVETRQLKILRSYIAACLVQRDILQKPPLPQDAPNKNGEILFLIDLHRAITEAMVKIWAEGNGSEADRSARSEWLLLNMYLEGADPHNLSVEVSIDEARTRATVFYSGLLLQALAINTNGSNRSEVRRKYFEWLTNYILWIRFKLDPFLLKKLAHVLKKNILAFTQNGNVESQIAIALAREFYQDLPDIIQEEISKDTDFLNAIGLNIVRHFAINDLDFFIQDFLQSAAIAMDGVESRIKTADEAKEIILTAEKNKSGHHILYCQHIDTNQKIEISDELLDVLLPTIEERKASLLKHQDLFDAPIEIFDTIATEISIDQDVQRRFDKFESWLEKSVSKKYKDLRIKLLTRKGYLSQDLMPASAEGLLRHFRMQNDSSQGSEFIKNLENSASVLIRECGLIEAIDRLSGLPIAMPNNVIQTLSNLKQLDRNDIISELLKKPNSPISDLHLVFILLKFKNESAEYIVSAKEILRKLTDNKTNTSIESFINLLNYIYAAFDEWPETEGWNTSIRLAMTWGHAHRLYSIFKSVDALLTLDNEQFAYPLGGRTVGILTKKSDWFDIAHPCRINYLNFLLLGLNYCLDSDSLESFDPELMQYFDEITFANKEEKLSLARQMSRDRSLAANRLGSFLGIENHVVLKNLFVDKHPEFLKPFALFEMANEAISKLEKENDQINYWQQLFVVIGDLPIYDNLTHRFKTIIIKTDFVKLFKEDLQLGRFVLRACALQTRNFSDSDMQLHLNENLKNLALYFRETQQFQRDKGLAADLSSSLCQAALDISVFNDSEEESIARFTSTLDILLEIWPPIAPFLKTVIFNLGHNLPFRYARLLWPLIIRLRLE